MLTCKRDKFRVSGKGSTTDSGPGTDSSLVSAARVQARYGVVMDAQG